MNFYDKRVLAIKEKLLKKGYTVIHEGSYNEKLLRNISLDIATHKYLELNEIFFEDSKDPTHATWFDIEGIDYGWIFLRVNSEQDYDVKKRLYKYTLNMFKKGYILNLNSLKYFILEKDSVKIYYIISNKKEYLKDFVIKISNKELESFDLIL